jgi:hypothetical protein
MNIAATHSAVRAFFCALAMSSLAFADGATKPDGPRIWTSSDGRKLEGTYLKTDKTKVSVRRVDGRVVEIPMALLAEEDRKFVAANSGEQQAAAKPEARPQHLSYVLPEGSENWDSSRKTEIIASMDAAVGLYNEHGVFKKRISANNSPGTPTADANYDGWINFGGTRNTRVALHEISHTLGVGTHPNWQKNIKDGKWTGKHALKQLREFDGPDATLSADRMHFWPYGLNFDQESSPENDIRHVKMVAALRKDMDIR